MSGAPAANELERGLGTSQPAWYTPRHVDKWECSMETAAKKAEGNAGRIRLEDAWPLYELHAACMRNAVELKEKAELLLLGKRYARAVSLAITAREELGKAQIVADRIDGAVTQREFEEAGCPTHLRSLLGAPHIRVFCECVGVRTAPHVIRPPAVRISL